MNTRILLAVASFAILLTVGNLDGQTNPIERMSETDVRAQMQQKRREILKGLPGVAVFAWWNTMTPSEENARLQSAVELRLRNNGIRVTGSAAEHFAVPGQPILMCGVSYRRLGPVLVAKIAVELNEEVRITRNSILDVVPTWRNELPQDKVVESPSFEQAREWLFEAVDEFCNGYRAVNPKVGP